MSKVVDEKQVAPAPQGAGQAGEATNPEIKLPVQWRNPIVAAVFSFFAVLIAIFCSGVSKFSFHGATSWFEIPNLELNSKPFVIICALGVLGTSAMIWKLALDRKRVPGWLTALMASFFIVAFLFWTVAGKDGTMPIMVLLTGGLSFSVPLVFGALTGAVCERTGVINIAIEGQLLVGAFAGALVGSMAGAWIGLIFAPIAGIALGALLALFTVNLRADHIIVGVVLNMLALGITSFFFKAIMTKDPATYNEPKGLPNLPIPVLCDIPIIGPVLFDNTILVYLMFAAVIILQLSFFRTRWGLRSRACGEHPKAADTVGIHVNWYRWKNVLLAGAIAGLGGACLTLQSGLPFQENMSAGKGFIALAAMILGRWNPKGGFAAALLFGYLTQLGALMSTVGAPLPSEFMQMTPYVITILAVAGFVGRVRPPAMEGKPYPA